MPVRALNGRESSRNSKPHLHVLAGMVGGSLDAVGGQELGHVVRLRLEGRVRYHRARARQAAPRPQQRQQRLPGVACLRAWE